MKEAITIKEIARRLKISPSTVSRALQDNPRIGQKTREAVRELAAQLRYAPSQTARNLRSGKTGVFAMVLPEIRENFFSEVVNGVEELAFSHHYTVALYQSHDLFDREQQILSMLARNQVDGVMLSVAKESQQFGHIQDLIDRGIPVVLFDRIPPKIETHQVGCDMEKGAYEATKWLASRGFGRIALLNGPHALVASEDRYRGYIKALLEEKLPVESALVKRVDLTTDDTSQKMTQLLTTANRPDAVLAFNDYVALDAMQVCRKNGLRINEDISFVSFANLPLTAYMDHSPLASVEQHPYQIGRKAVEILLSIVESTPDDQDNGFQRIMLDPELVIRMRQGDSSNDSR
ncbi:LacI family DNA-binding transcriptional regulator [Spirosoma validum]|uniref:LacI family DNA-binding transcriptional regulator n=1 Tax=Spirosoma validum TaxID=2771355 RepID=A0A927GGA8_9BACT|nr:LacI family DNA-binding transcriptional regulator [Spirosoma validum]MBD2756802.1 LacI family DNA-binding transcriptional regulator [Spirosoma validum]